MEPHHLILKFSILSLTIIASVAHSNYADGGPIIGIVSLPSDIDGYASDSYSYFPASYVKFVESGGARVIPIPYDLSQERILFLLERLNGVFFTGGDAAYFNEDGSFTHVATTLQFIVNYIVNKNSQGLYYPLWGTCQGFEAIACTLAGSFDVRSECMDCEVVNKYNYVNDEYQSRLLSLMPASLIEKMSYEKISYFAEYYKFGADLFESGGPLYEVLEPVTFAYDADGSKYVSSFESPTMPIYGTQFHQEKSTYEWHSLSPYNHSLDAVMLQQFLSDFFVQETWKNNNTFSDVSDYLIENFISNVVHDSGYSAVYMFPAQGSDNSDSESDGNDDDSTSGLSTSDSPAESSSTSSSSKDLDLNLTSNQQNQYSNTIHAYGMTIIFSMLLYFFN